MLRDTLAPLLALLCILFVPDSASAVKTRPPIELSFSYRYLSENETHITLIVKANVTTTKVAISLELPLGLRLLEGKEDWEGLMKRGDQKKIEITVQEGGFTSYEILGKADIHLLKGGIFKQEGRLVLDRSGSKTLDRRPPIQNKSPRGNILEFRN